MRFLLKAAIVLIVPWWVIAQTVPQKPPLPSYKDLKFPPLRQVKIPEVTTATLPNGMKLFLVEDHELPLVSGFALVRTGNLFEPPDKVGLAQLTGTVLRTGGTKTRTGDQLDEQLENVAASVESGIEETSGRVSFSALRENTDEVLAAFRDLLTAPEFRQEKLDLAKTQLRSAISRRNDDADHIAGQEFDETLYGRDTPYGRRVEYENVDRIQRDDLVAFYKRYFFPANIMLAVYGDFSVAEMKAKIEKLFGGWDYPQPAVPPFPEVREKPAPGVYVASKEEVTMTFFRLGHLGGVLRDKNYPALEVMADILGGGFRSRLFRKVRTQLGYAYDISADWGANYGHPGAFVIGGSTNSLSTTQTLEAIEAEVAKIRTSEVSDDELRTARESVLNSFVFNFDTPGKTLSRLVTYEYYGYPKDFIFQYQKGVAAVTKADILRVAKQYIRPQDFTIVAVGKTADFVKPLTALGPKVTPIDLTIPEPKREAAKTDPASVEKGRQLLGRVQKAVGGAEKLAAVRDFTYVSSAEIKAGPGTMKIRKTERWLAPSQIRQDQELPFGKVVAYFDGTTGWLVTPQGPAPLQGAFLQQQQGELFRLFFRLWLSDRDPASTVTSAGEDAIEISDREGNRTRLQVDAGTGLPVKQTYRMPGSPPAMGDIDETYSDWKDVDGIKLPQKISIRQAGGGEMVVSIEDMKLNSGLKTEELSKRP